MDFKRLHTLEIRRLALERFDPDLFRLAFGHLGETLRALLLRGATLTSNKFVELLNLLPRLHCIGLDCFTVARRPFRAPRKLPAFAGTLNLSGPVNEHSFRFMVNLPRILQNFSLVRLRLNLSYDATRRLLHVPGFASNVTTMLLGYQDGMQESINLSQCYNLRILSVRTQWSLGRLSTLAAQETFFQMLETITSRELEFLIVEANRELPLMQYKMWQRLFGVSSALQTSGRPLSVVVEPYERFMMETFRKGETLARFLGCRREGKRMYTDIA